MHQKHYQPIDIVIFAEAVSDKMSPDDFKEFIDFIEGDYIEIGVIFEIDKRKNVIITEILKNSPAERAGLLIGDRFIEINGELVPEDYSVEQISKLLRGDITTPLFIRVQRRDAIYPYFSRQPLLLKREKLNMPFKTEVFEFAKARIGYIHFYTFGYYSAALFCNSANGFAHQGIRNIILDLRNNAGGYPSIAKQIARCSGMGRHDVMGIEISRDERVSNVIREPVARREFFNKIFILINKGSVSVAEKLPAALRDNFPAKTLILGEKSGGKGVGQEIQNLGVLGYCLKYTNIEFISPNGIAHNKIGSTRCYYY